METFNLQDYQRQATCLGWNVQNERTIKQEKLYASLMKNAREQSSKGWKRSSKPSLKQWSLLLAQELKLAFNTSSYDVTIHFLTEKVILYIVIYLPHNNYQNSCIIILIIFKVTGHFNHQKAKIFTSTTRQRFKLFTVLLKNQF